MKIAGYIITPLGVLAFIGTLLGGHSPIGPLFWIAVGIVLLVFGYRKKAKDTGETQSAEPIDKSAFPHVNKNSVDDKKFKAWGICFISVSFMFFCAWVFISYFPEYQVRKTTRNIENEIVNGDTYIVDIKSLDSLTYHSIPPQYIYADGRLRKYKNFNQPQTNKESFIDTLSIYDQRGKFDIVVDSTIIKPYTIAFEIDYLIRKSEFCIGGKNSYEVASITTDPFFSDFTTDYHLGEAVDSWVGINSLRENALSEVKMQPFFQDTLSGMTKTLFFYTQGDENYFYTENFRNDNGEIVKTCGAGCINIIDKRPFLYINNDTISNKEQCQPDIYMRHSLCEYQIKPYRIFYKNDSNINPIADIKESFSDLAQNISSGKINGQEGASVQMTSNITPDRIYDSFNNNNSVHISHWIETNSPIICDGCITSPFKHNYHKGSKYSITNFYQNKYASNSNYGIVDEDLIYDFLQKYGKPYLYFFEYNDSWFPRSPQLKDIYSQDGILSLADSLLLLPTIQSYKFYQNKPNVNKKHDYISRLTPKPLKYEEWDQYINDVRRAKANDRLFNYPMYYYTTISKHNYDVIYVLTSPKYYSYEVYTDYGLSDRIKNICVPILVVGIIFLIVGFLLLIIYKRTLHAK